MLTDQLAVMNKDYAPQGISFTLKGTDRTINSNWASDGAELAMKKALRKGTYRSLNLYFLKSLGDGNLGMYHLSAFTHESNPPLHPRVLLLPHLRHVRKQ